MWNPPADNITNGDKKLLTAPVALLRTEVSVKKDINSEMVMSSVAYQLNLMIITLPIALEHQDLPEKCQDKEELKAQRKLERVKRISTWNPIWWI